MKFIRAGLCMAGLLLAVSTFAAPAASADPIGAPWRGSGFLIADTGLDVVRCDVAVGGSADGNAITAATFSACRGVLTNPMPLLPWAVTWNAGNTGGTIAVALLTTYLFSSCLHGGTVGFTYTSRTITIPVADLVKVSGPSFPCTARLRFGGTIAVA